MLLLQPNLLFQTAFAIAATFLSRLSGSSSSSVLSCTPNSMNRVLLMKYDTSTMAVGRKRFSRTWARLLGLAHFYLQQRCSPSLFAKVLYAASALHLTHAICAQLQLASLHTSVQGLGATSYCNHCFGSTVQFYCAIAPLGPFQCLRKPPRSPCEDYSLRCALCFCNYGNICVRGVPCQLCGSDGLGGRPTIYYNLSCAAMDD